MTTARTLGNFGDSLGGNVLVIDSGGNVGIGTSTMNAGNALAVYGGNVVIGTTGSGLRFPDGTTQATAAAVINVQTFTSSGTWTKPSGYSASSRVFVQCWGGGGSGSKGSGGGGGGGYNEGWLTLSQFSATQTATIGAGGTAVTAASTAGNPGGTTSIGSLISAYGGGGGETDIGGGGGGQISAGSARNPGRPVLYYQGFGYSVAVNNGPVGGFWHGGAAGGAFVATGTDSVWGGGGGGGASAGAGGTSVWGGNGGAGVSAGAGGIAGTQPGGGGGATSTGTASGAGGAGKIIVTIFPA